MGPLRTGADTGTVTAYLGLGTNVGDRLANLERALQMLGSTPGVTVGKPSSVYETEPWGLTEQPRFLNAAVEVRTILEPGALLSVVKAIEVEMGRVATVRYGPRVIDIDILLYGDRVIDWETPDLQIPHARMAERAFVLLPLAEIAGEVQHPGLDVRISNLAEVVEGREGVVFGTAEWKGGLRQ